MVFGTEVALLAWPLLWAHHLVLIKLLIDSLNAPFVEWEIDFIAAPHYLRKQNKIVEEFIRQ